MAGKGKQPSIFISGSKHGNYPTNFSEFEPDGSMKMNGAATIFDDKTWDVLSLKTLGTWVTTNAVEWVVEYTTVANLNDYIYTNVQMPHSRKIGSIIYPHIHRFQAEANIPNRLVQYRRQINGGVKTTAWTNYKSNVNAFTYVSGTIHQISHDSGITPPGGATLSDIIQFRVIRDSINASWVFTWADAYTATVWILSFDVHFEKDTMGSRQEYIK